MDGGHVYGKGKKGKVYNVACVDTHSLCYDIVSSPEKSLVLYTLSDDRIPLSVNHNALFIELIANRKDLVIKQFPGNSVGRRSFYGEYDGILHLFEIYGKLWDQYLAVQTLPFKYGRKIYNIIGFQYGSEYYVFNKKCTQNLTSMIETLTRKQIDQMIASILESLVILQKKKYTHNDIKFDNIMYCDEKFKLIDWERALDIEQLQHRLLVRGDYDKPYGSRFFMLPLEQYIYTNNFASDAYSNVITYSIFHFTKKIPITLKEFHEYWNFYIEKCLNPTKRFVNVNKQSKLELIHIYKNSFDTFSVGIIVAIIAFIRNLPQKYLRFAESLTNIEHPKFALSAADALRNMREILK